DARGGARAVADDGRPAARRRRPGIGPDAESRRRRGNSIEGSAAATAADRSDGPPPAIRRAGPEVDGAPRGQDWRRGRDRGAPRARRPRDERRQSGEQGKRRRAGRRPDTGGGAQPTAARARPTATTSGTAPRRGRRTGAPT